MKFSFKTLGTISLLCSLSVSALAASLGDVANNMLVPLAGIKELLHVVIILTAAGLTMGALMMIKTHFQNPVEVPLSRPIMMLVAAVALVGLLFIPITWES